MQIEQAALAEQPKLLASREAEPKLFKVTKYPNRKLYAYNHGQYVNLAAIKAAVHEGYSVVVTEHKTGRDLTEQTLRAIFQKWFLAKFPIELVHQKISTELA